MVKEIPLTKGMVALVDEEDYARVAAFKWHASKRRRDKCWYATRSIPNPRMPGRRTKLFMHREILGCASDVDHRNGNGLINTRQNLRPATKGENNHNIGKPRHGVTSRYKGVCWHPGAQKFQATIRYLRKNYYLGLFKTETEAAWTYDREARLKFGAFARCNFPPPPMIVDGAAT